MPIDNQGAVWGTVTLAGWKIEGGDEKATGTDLRGFFKAMAEQTDGKEAVLRFSLLVKCLSGWDCNPARLAVLMEQTGAGLPLF